MVGTIDIAPDGSCLFVSFPYREDLVSIVRNIPGRRWDRASKIWRVPLDQVENCVKIFMAHGFTITPGVATTLATGGKDTGLDKIKFETVDKESQSYSVSSLNLQVGEVLRGEFKEALWVIGELQNFDKSKKGRHRYFELVERQEDEFGEVSPRPRASVSAAIFEKSWPVIRKRLASGRQKLELSDGIKVRVRGRVDFYQARGRYQFIVEDLDPSYTFGDQLLNRDKILKKLEEQGLHETNLSKPLAVAPLRIALITSWNSDAYNDFIQTLASEPYRYEVTVHPVAVQGDSLRPTVLRALEYFEEMAEDFDVLVITRGGGSRTELGAWDDEEVAMRVAKHPLKAVIGIGHERDQCVLDLIATSVKTPTAAAELLGARVRAYQEHVEDTMLSILDYIETRLRSTNRDLAAKGRLLTQVVRGGIASAKGSLHAANARLRRGMLHRIGGARQGLELAKHRIQSGVKNRIQRESDRLDLTEARRRALDPQRVLERGFAILVGKDGKALRSVKDTKKGDALEARLPDGSVDLEVVDLKVKGTKSH